MNRMTPERRAAILRHHLVDGWPIGTIATQLDVHHETVRRCLRQHGVPLPQTHQRPRKADPYVDFIREQLAKYPKLHASRLFQMVRSRGYDGCESHFRRIVAEIRPPRVHEPFLRLHHLPGEQAQVDWAYFGIVPVGRATRKLYGLVMTLSWSRMTWLSFFFDMQMANFLRGHVDALRFFGGVPRQLLYDNLKSAVLERQGQAIRFNPQLLDLATHYGFEPKAAGVRRGNEKGVVERAIRYVRSSFFAAREFRDIDTLNREARSWCVGESANRRWPNDDRRTVADAFAEERDKLRVLPDNDFVAVERTPVKVGRTPWIRFDKNDYSVPPTYTRRRLDVIADHQRVRIVADGNVIADHERSYDRHTTVTDSAHATELRQLKRQARQPSATHRLVSQAPAAELFLERAAQRGHNLGSLTSRLMLLLDIYGAAQLQAAITVVNERNVVSAANVRLVLEQHARASGRVVRLPVRLPRPDLADLVVRPPDLRVYDQLSSRSDDESDEEGNDHG